MEEKGRYWRMGVKWRRRNDTGVNMGELVEKERNVEGWREEEKMEKREWGGGDPTKSRIFVSQ